MCDPLTATAVALTVASGTASAYGQYQSGKYQEKVAKNNALIQGRMAEDALKRGQIKSQQAAKMGAAGIDMGVGSAADMLADTAMMGELDALTLRSNAQREAWGHDVQASNFLSEGRLSSYKGNYGAASTILGTAGTAVGMSAGAMESAPKGGTKTKIGTFERSSYNSRVGKGGAF
jgi:hypothetical protein